MKLLYIHGLHSKPRADKSAILETFAEEVFAPQIDYFGREAVFPALLDLCRTQNVDTLVGSSAGGLMAFWLNKYLGKKALLFNPALKFQSFRPDIVEPKKDNLDTNYFNYIILGKQDDTISPKETLQYLEEGEDTKNYKVEVIEDLAHQIDLGTFRYAMESFIKMF